MYKKTINKKTQKPMWFKDGKLISEKNVPEEIKSPPKTITTKTSEGIEITETNEDISAPKPQQTPPEAPGEAKETKPEPDTAFKIKELKTCIFDKSFADSRRAVWFDGAPKEIPVCGDCYLNKTLGEIVQQLNKLKEKQNDNKS